MGDFRSIVFVSAGSVRGGWEDLSLRRRVASQPVGNQLPRWPLLLLQNFAKEALSGSLVSVARDQDIEDIAILVHRSPKITACATDRDEQLVSVPDVTETTLSPPQGSGIRRSKLPAPGSNGFVGHGDAALGKKVLDIAKAQSEPMVQSNSMADNLGWKPVAPIQ